VLHLLDASVLLIANHEFYGVNQVPEFWEWVHHKAQGGKIKLATEIYEEIKDDEHGVGEWARRDDIRKSLLLEEDVDIKLVRQVVSNGYAADLNELELEELGRDPFLIAYALADPRNRTVVTVEKSKPTSQRKNRKIPDVCKDLGVKCCDTATFTKTLGFSTDWKTRADRN
jgi:hypothetical protein